MATALIENLYNLTDMKRLLTLACLAMQASSVLFAGPIDAEKASELARDFMPTGAGEPALVRKAPRKSNSGVRLAKAYTDTAPYYIFSRGKGQGFIIVSGDDALPGVLGYTEKGDYDEDNMPPFLSWYLDYYGGMVEAAQAAGASASDAPVLTATGRTDIQPLLETHWNQGTPYNDLCPTLKAGGRGLTGCVATAASQVVYYWRKDLPTETAMGTGSYVYGSEANATTAFPKGTKMKWDLMRTQYSGSEPDEYKTAVATLMAFVGGGAGLTYGSSTSGHNGNCIKVFSGAFGLNGGTDNSKDWGQAYNNYSDDAWATLLYNELSKSRPVLYSGCNAKGEGHAVVVDGYQASTGYFHFNLGWGGGGDGYFTVARGKSPSWGFNDSWQECVTGVYPKRTNMSAEFVSHATVYANRTNDFTFEVTNNGTLDYSGGIYFFANTTGSAPTNISSAKDKDTETVIPNTGEAVRFTMSAKPNSDSEWYFYVTDASLNVLAKQKVQPTVPVSKLYLKDMTVEGSAETEVHGGVTYRAVYNSKATATVVFQNKSAVGFEGNPRMSIYESVDGGQTFQYKGYKTAAMNIGGGETGTATFSITPTSSCAMSVGNLYYGVVQDTITGLRVEDVINKQEAANCVVRFVLKGSDMEVVGFENNCLALSGTWDANAFTTFAKKQAYKNATSYDLTGVTKITGLPLPPNNPNALYYISGDANPSSGYNYVKDGVCPELVLVAGYDFVPRDGFKALSATLDIAQKADKWGFVTVPFDADVPSGMIARRIDSHTSSGISSKTTNMTSLVAGCTYEIMASSSEKQLLTGTDVDVVSGVTANVDNAVVGTFVNTTTPGGAMQINDDDPQFVDVVEEGTAVEALRGYFHASDVTKSFRAYSIIISDPTYLTLAKNIETAYNAIEDNGAYSTQTATEGLRQLIENAEVMFTERAAGNLEVRAAYQSLDSAVTAYLDGAINPNLNLDCTSFITNPSFEDGKTTGWTTKGTVYNSSALIYKSVNADGTYYLADCQADSVGSGVSQVVSGLYPGRYRMTVMVGSSEGHQITVFAGDTTVTVDASDLGAHYLTKAVIDGIRVDQSGELEIGVKSGFYYKADDFRLTLTEFARAAREDVNGDGLVDTQDAEAVYEYMRSQPDGSADPVEDVNGDGTVDTQDVLKIYEYIKRN